ncbi:hypothetical protein BGZ73_001730, partial [Actinomortierella ambigua]
AKKGASYRKALDTGKSVRSLRDLFIREVLGVYAAPTPLLNTHNKDALYFSNLLSPPLQLRSHQLAQALARQVGATSIVRMVPSCDNLTLDTTISSSYEVVFYEDTPHQATL